MPEAKSTEWATIGQIVALFGVRGELKVRLLTDIPDRLQQLEFVYLSPDQKKYGIEHVRPYKGEMVIIKLAGVDDASAAELLRQQSLLIPLSQLAKLPPDSYYQHDILGLTVSTLDNRKLGPIVDIIETGSNDVYVIKGADGKQVLIPAIKAVVKQIELIRRTMYIDPLPGLLESVTREDEEAEIDDSAEESEDEL